MGTAVAPSASIIPTISSDSWTRIFMPFMSSSFVIGLVEL